MNTMKVLERPLSIRRPSQLNEEEDESYSFNVDGDKGGDESKTRKNTSFTRATNYKTRAGCIFPSLLLIIALFFLIFYYLPPYRNLVCGSDPLSRTQFLGYGDLETDFGSLGVPWCRSKHRKTVEWTSKDLLRALEDFVPIYETRPIKSNMYGMGFDHSFGLWFMTRWLKPLLMIESGAYKGHSTWILRKAIPDRPIITISPRHPGKYLKKGPAYVDGNCTYYSGKNFRDFGSIDWKSVVRKYGISDMSRVLVFFDDHQNELKRLKQAFKAGFKHLVFEDNYDTGTGDHYSLRQICDQFYIRGGGHSCFEDGDEARMRSKRKKIWEKGVEIEQLCGPGGAWWGVAGQMRDNFNHSNKVHARKKAMAEDVDYMAVASMTDGMVGAELANILEIAAINMLRDGRTEITTDDLLQAAQIEERGMLDRKERSVEIWRQVALNEAAMAVAAMNFPDLRNIEFLNISPRAGRELGYVRVKMNHMKFNEGMLSRQSVLDHITVLLAPRAADELWHGDGQLSTIWAETADNARSAARTLVIAGLSDKYYGLNNFWVADRNSEIDVEAMRIVNMCYERAKKILEGNRKLVDVVVSELVEKKSLAKQEFFHLVELHGCLEPTPPSIVDIRAKKREEFQQMMMNRKEATVVGGNS